VVSGLPPSLGAAIALAVVLSLLLLRARQNYRGVPELTRTSTDPPPDCMVVIPARDEEQSIARAVKSFPPDTVIVVDDQSADGTAEEARQAGAGVLPAPPLPRGAAGKAHACMAGARVLTSRWVLFADADTWYEPQFLDASVEAAHAAEVDLVSIHPRTESGSLAEHILVPYLAALFFSGASLRGAFPALFSGRCLLVRREAYEFIGGHGAVLKQVFDEVGLAANARRHRLRISAVRAAGLGHVRLYAGWRGIWSGIERDASRLLLAAPHAGVILLFTAACAALWIPLVVRLWTDGTRAAAAALALLPILLLWPWYGIRRVWLAPLAVYAALPFLIHGTLRALAGRPSAWKGRSL
jgi:chlorobactene glucosyltransferase